MKDLRGEKDDKVEEEDMQLCWEDVKLKEAKSPRNSSSDEEGIWGESSSSGRISIFSSTTSSDSDADLYDSPVAALDKGGLHDLSVNAINGAVPCYLDSPPVKPKLQYNSWVPSCAADIKLLARISSCESIKELDDLKAKLNTDGQVNSREYFNGREGQLYMLQYKQLWKYEMMEKLIAFVPYIEGKKYSVKEKDKLLWVAREKNLVSFEDYYSKFLIKLDFFEILEMCIDMLKDVEGDKIFHPLIRMGYKDDMLKLISLSKRAHKISKLHDMNLSPGQLMLPGRNRPDCLPQRVVERFFADKRKTDEKYIKANKMVSLIRRFESHLASFNFEMVLEEKLKLDIKKKDINNLKKVARELVNNREIVPEEYGGSLGKDLIEQSLEERLFFTQMSERLKWYASWLFDLLDEKDEKSEGETMTDSLIQSRGGVRFFECSKQYKEEEGLIDQSVWEEKEVCDFIEAVEKEAFPDLPKQYVVRGILDYCDYLKERKEKGKDFPKEYREEFVSSIRQQIDSLKEYWRTTRYFDHEIYKNSMLTERMNWGEIKDIEKSLNDILEEMRRPK